MSRTSTAMDRLAAVDPMRGSSTAERTLPTAPVRRRRALPRVAVAAAAVVALTAGAFVLLPGGAAAPADARAVDSLLAAGRAAATAADAPLGPGQLVYSRTESASFTQVTLRDGTTASYLGGARTNESWIARDGALTRVEIATGQPWYPTARDRQLVEESRTANGTKDDTGGGTPGVSGRAVVRIPPYEGTVNAPTYDYARTLPTDPAALEQLIRRTTSGAGENADVEVWVTVGDMLLSPVSPPALRAALYQVAANVPGVEFLGPTKDRLGRTGTGVALSHGDADHARTREVMVFDPSTGLLLGTEQRALDPSQWGLPAADVDAVVGWQVWVTAGVVDGLGVRPDGSHVDTSG